MKALQCPSKTFQTTTYILCVKEDSVYKTVARHVHNVFVSQVIKCIKVSVLGCVSNGLWGQKNCIPYQISLVIVCSLVPRLLTTTANQRPSTSDHFSLINLLSVSYFYFTIVNGVGCLIWTLLKIYTKNIYSSSHRRIF